MADVLVTHSYHLPFDRKQVRKMQPYPPLGTLYAAAVLRQGGVSVAVFDPMLAEPISGFREALEPEKVLTTVLFTDIVGSTDQARELGDSQWTALLEQHHATVRTVLAQYRGREIDTTGDGFLAGFDGPARGIRCAQGILEALGRIGIEARAGLHTGEVEMVGDNIAGIAVHIGARVAALAGPREVLVSSTVRDLVAGSGIEFEDRGLHELKGLDEPRRLFAVRLTPA